MTFEWNRRKDKTALRFTASAIVASFLFTTISAPFAEASFWEQRKQASEAFRKNVQKEQTLQLASAAGAPFYQTQGSADALLPGKVSVDLAREISAFSRPKSSVRRQANGDAAAVPQWIWEKVGGHGSIENVHIVPGRPLIVHVQDVHNFLSAQKNIAFILRGLMAQGIDLVGVEGSAGKMEGLEHWSRYPDRDSLIEAAGYLMENGFLTGVELAGLADSKKADAAQGSKPEFFGIEEQESYLRQVEAFKTSLDKASSVRDWEARQQSLLDGIKAAKYGQALRALDREEKKHERGELNLGDWIQYLASARGNIAAYPNVSKYLGIYSVEKNLDFAKVKAEQGKILRELSSKLNREQLIGLLEDSLAYRLGNMESSDFYAGIRRRCVAAGVALAPEFSRYMDYVLGVEGISRNGLFAEVKKLQEDVWTQSLKTAEEISIRKMDEDMALAKKALDFTLSPEEWGRYVTRRDEILRLDVPDEVKTVLENAARFNGLSDKRSEIFIQKLTARMTETGKTSAILIAGGYHSLGIESELRRHDLSFVTVRPRLDAAEMKADKHPLAAFMRAPVPLEQAFAQEKISIAPQQALGGVDPRTPMPVARAVNGFFRTALTALSGRKNAEAAAAAEEFTGSKLGERKFDPATGTEAIDVRTGEGNTRVYFGAAESVRVINGAAASGELKNPFDSNPKAPSIHFALVRTPLSLFRRLFVAPFTETKISQSPYYLAMHGPQTAEQMRLRRAGIEKMLAPSRFERPVAFVVGAFAGLAASIIALTVLPASLGEHIAPAAALVSVVALGAGYFGLRYARVAANAFHHFAYQLHQWSNAPLTLHRGKGDTADKDASVPSVAVVNADSLKGTGIETALEQLKQGDTLVIGGGIAYLFITARYMASRNMNMNNIQQSPVTMVGLVEEFAGATEVNAQELPLAFKLFKQASEAGVDVLLPIDHVVSDKKPANGKVPEDAILRSIEGEKIPAQHYALDSGPNTKRMIEERIRGGKLIDPAASAKAGRMSLFSGSENYEKYIAPIWESPVLSALIAIAPAFALFHFHDHESAGFIENSAIMGMYFVLLATLSRRLGVGAYVRMHDERAGYVAKAALLSSDGATMGSVAAGLIGFLVFGFPGGLIAASAAYAVVHTIFHLINNVFAPFYYYRMSLLTRKEFLEAANAAPNRVRLSEAQHKGKGIEGWLFANHIDVLGHFRDSIVVGFIVAAAPAAFIIQFFGDSLSRGSAASWFLLAEIALGGLIGVWGQSKLLPRVSHAGWKLTGAVGVGIAASAISLLQSAVFDHSLSFILIKAVFFFAGFYFVARIGIIPNLAPVQLKQLAKRARRLLNQVVVTMALISIMALPPAVALTADSSGRSERRKLSPRAVVDTDEPTSPAYMPQILAIGSASGRFNMPTSRIHELIGSKPGSRWIEDRLDIQSRRFAHPEEDMSVVAVRAVVNMILSHVSSLSSEDFLEAVEVIPTERSRRDLTDAHEIAERREIVKAFEQVMAQVNVERIANLEGEARLKALAEGFLRNHIDHLDFAGLQKAQTTIQSELSKGKLSRERAAIYEAFLQLNLGDVARAGGAERAQLMLKPFIQFSDPAMALSVALGFDPYDAVARAFGWTVLGNVRKLSFSTSTTEREVIPTGSAHQAALVAYGMGHAPVQSGNNVCGGIGFAVDTARGTLADGEEALVITFGGYSDILNLAEYTSGPLFGDMAMAVVLGQPNPKRKINGFVVRTYQHPALWTSGIPRGFISQTGPMNTFTMDNQTVGGAFADQVQKVFVEFLTRHGLTVDDLSAIAIHQPQKGLIRTIAENLGVGQIATVKADGSATVEKVSDKNEAKVFWIGQELANGEAAASGVALSLVLRAKDKDGQRLFQLRKDGKPTLIAQLAFGGGASISAVLYHVDEAGNKIPVDEAAIEFARDGQLAPVDGKAGSIALNAYTTDSRYPEPSAELVKSHLIENLRHRGQAWDAPKAKPHSFEEVLMVGFGNQGWVKAYEFSRMRSNKKIYVMTRTPESFLRGLAEAKVELQRAEYLKFLKRLGLTEAGIKRGEYGSWIAASAMNPRMFNGEDGLLKKVKIVFEATAEDMEVKTDLIAQVWNANPRIGIVTNTSSLNVLDLARIAAEKAWDNLSEVERTHMPLEQFVEHQARRLIAQHDHSPARNNFDNISDPRKREIDPALYASIVAFDRANGKAITYTDDKFPLFDGNRLVFGGAVREALALIAEGYSLDEIHAAATDTKRYEDLPALGFDPIEMILGVDGYKGKGGVSDRFEAAKKSGKGLPVTYHILENHQKYYGEAMNWADIVSWESIQASKVKSDWSNSRDERVAHIRKSLFAALWAEQFRAVQDNAVRHPRWLDFALTHFGLNLRTGGLLQLADDYKLNRVLGLMLELSARPGRGHLAPSRFVMDMAQSGQTFESRYGWPARDEVARSPAGNAILWEQEWKRNPGRYQEFLNGEDLLGMTLPKLDILDYARTELSVDPAIAEEYRDIFGKQRVNGRSLEVEQTIAELTRQYSQDFENVLAERSRFREAVANGEARYGFADLAAAVSDADGNVRTVGQIRQGMADGFLGKQTDEAWKLNESQFVPRAILKPGLQGTGPFDKLDMAMGAINTGLYGAVSWMADWEDAGNDMGNRFYQAWRNLRQIIHGQWDRREYIREKDGKKYSIKPVYITDKPVLFHRVPGLHIRNRQMKTDGKPVPGMIAALVIHVLNNRDALAAQGAVPAFYIPKIETPREALLVASLLKSLEEKTGLKRGTLKIEMLHERGRYTANQESIMWILRENLVGPNVGRWDYINSRIEMGKDDANAVFPDPHTVGMTDASMTEYTRRNALLTLLVGGFPIGGMSAVMKMPGAPQEVNDKAVRSIWFDKLRERLTGLFFIDGSLYDTYRQSWVATTEEEYVRAGAEPLQTPYEKLPELISRLTPDEFSRLTQLGLISADGTIIPYLVNIDRISEELYSESAWEKLFQTPKGDKTETGLRYAIYMASEYMFQILNGNFAAAIEDPLTGNRLMNDLATFEIFWHWLYTAKMHEAELTQDGVGIAEGDAWNRLGYAPIEGLTEKGDNVTSGLIKKLLAERRAAVNKYFEEHPENPQGFDRSLANVTMDVLERMLDNPEWITYGSRILMSVLEKTESERNEILDAVLSSTREETAEKVESGEWSAATLQARDYIYDHFESSAMAENSEFGGRRQPKLAFLTGIFGLGSLLGGFALFSAGGPLVLILAAFAAVVVYIADMLIYSFGAFKKDVVGSGDIVRVPSIGKLATNVRGRDVQIADGLTFQWQFVRDALTYRERFFLQKFGMAGDIVMHAFDPLVLGAFAAKSFGRKVRASIRGDADEMDVKTPQISADVRPDLNYAKTVKEFHENISGAVVVFQGVKIVDIEKLAALLDYIRAEAKWSQVSGVPETAQWILRETESAVRNLAARGATLTGRGAMPYSGSTGWNRPFHSALSLAQRGIISFKEIRHLAAAKILGLPVVESRFGRTEGLVQVRSGSRLKNILFLLADPVGDLVMATAALFAPFLVAMQSDNSPLGLLTAAVTFPMAYLFAKSGTTGSRGDWRGIRSLIRGAPVESLLTGRSGSDRDEPDAAALPAGDAFLSEALRVFAEAGVAQRSGWPNFYELDSQSPAFTPLASYLANEVHALARAALSRVAGTELLALSVEMDNAARGYPADQRILNMIAAIADRDLKGPLALRGLTLDLVAGEDGAPSSIAVSQKFPSGGRMVELRFDLSAPKVALYHDASAVVPEERQVSKSVRLDLSQVGRTPLSRDISAESVHQVLAEVDRFITSGTFSRSKRSDIETSLWETLAAIRLSETESSLWEVKNDIHIALRLKLEESVRLLFYHEVLQELILAGNRYFDGDVQNISRGLSQSGDISSAFMAFRNRMSQWPSEQSNSYDEMSAKVLSGKASRKVALAAETGTSSSDRLRLALQISVVADIFANEYGRMPQGRSRDLARQILAFADVQFEMRDATDQVRMRTLQSFMKSRVNGIPAAWRLGRETALLSVSPALLMLPLLFSGPLGAVLISGSLFGVAILGPGRLRISPRGAWRRLRGALISLHLVPAPALSLAQAVQSANERSPFRAPYLPVADMAERWNTSRSRLIGSRLAVSVTGPGADALGPIIRSPADQFITRVPGGKEEFVQTQSQARMHLESAADMESLLSAVAKANGIALRDIEVVIMDSPVLSRRLELLKAISGRNPGMKVTQIHQDSLPHALLAAMGTKRGAGKHQVFWSISETGDAFAALAAAAGIPGAVASVRVYSDKMDKTAIGTQARDLSHRYNFNSRSRNLVRDYRPNDFADILKGGKVFTPRDAPGGAQVSVAFLEDNAAFLQPGLRQIGPGYYRLHTLHAGANPYMSVEDLTSAKVGRKLPLATSEASFKAAISDAVDFGPNGSANIKSLHGLRGLAGYLRLESLFNVNQNIRSLAEKALRLDRENPKSLTITALLAAGSGLLAVLFRNEFDGGVPFIAATAMGILYVLELMPYAWSLIRNGNDGSGRGWLNVVALNVRGSVTYIHPSLQNAPKFLRETIMFRESSFLQKRLGFAGDIAAHILDPFVMAGIFIRNLFTDSIRKSRGAEPSDVEKSLRQLRYLSGDELARAQADLRDSLAARLERAGKEGPSSRKEITVLFQALGAVYAFNREGGAESDVKIKELIESLFAGTYGVDVVGVQTDLLKSRFEVRATEADPSTARYAMQLQKFMSIDGSGSFHVTEEFSRALEKSFAWGAALALWATQPAQKISELEGTKMIDATSLIDNRGASPAKIARLTALLENRIITAGDETTAIVVQGMKSKEALARLASTLPTHLKSELYEARKSGRIVFLDSTDGEKISTEHIYDQLERLSLAAGGVQVITDVPDRWGESEKYSTRIWILELISATEVKIHRSLDNIMDEIEGQRILSFQA